MEFIHVAIAKEDDEDWKKGDWWIVSWNDFYSINEKWIYIDGEYHDRKLFNFFRYKRVEETSEASE
jgi:hypothetical protein